MGLSSRSAAARLRVVLGFVLVFTGTVASGPPVPGVHAAPPVFTGVAPARLLDTRVGSPTVDGQFTGTGRLGAGAVGNVTVLGRGGVPTAEVAAVALNVTVTGPTAGSFLTVFPAGSARPTASNLNFSAGQTVPNMVIVPVGVGGQISLFNLAGSVDVVVDVLGWFGAGSGFGAGVPARLLDTRPGGPTIDGQASGVGRIGPAQVLQLNVLGRGGVPATGVAGVALNVTVTGPTVASYVTVYPSGGTRPTASNLNFRPDQTVPNMVVVPPGANGQVSIFNLAGSVDVVVDVLGWFTVGSGFVGINPFRVADTRTRTWPTLDGPIAMEQLEWVSTTNAGGVPASGVSAVVVNITAIEPSEDTYLTAFPRGVARPTASNLNVTRGQVVPNLAILPVSATGQIALYNFRGSVHVAVDVLGYITGTPLTRPQVGVFSCSNTTLRNQLLAYMRIDASGATNNWLWNELDLDLAQSTGPVVVHMFDPVAGRLVVMVPGQAYSSTVAFVGKRRVGSIEEYMSFAGGGKFESGDAQLIHESYLNPIARVRFARSGISLSITSCTT